MLISDGFHTTVGVSPPFALADRAPQALIFEPLDGQTRPAGRAVDLNGQVLDPEDGFLEGETVALASDRDGLLGTGTALSVPNLSEGTHLITFSVTDSAGQTATAETTVVIGPTDLPDPAVVETVRLALAGESPPAPAAYPSTTQALAAAAPGETAGVGGVVAGAVGLMVLRRQRFCGVAVGTKPEDEINPPGPVLLVDDVVDSRWTLTVVGFQLRSLRSVG